MWEKCINMYVTHPSVINIRRHVKVEQEFHFTPITADEMEKKIAALNPRKKWGMYTYKNKPGYARNC